MSIKVLSKRYTQMSDLWVFLIANAREIRLTPRSACPTLIAKADLATCMPDPKGSK